MLRNISILTIVMFLGETNGKKSDDFPPSRRVCTSYGPIEGRRLISVGEKQVDAFQGIPYAAPPVGNLRFSLPQPHQPWTELRHTKQFGARGIQIDATNETTPQSEDNLTLNIFTPVWNPDNKSGFPVMFFIHGGGFIRDGASTYGDTNICQHLVTKGVIVVTIQYRLGFLGFWTTGDSQIPDNLAFHDMTFALKWIKDNIEKFNGDPENITLMGHSAGGAAVDILSISPISRDLFQKIIPMAGNADTLWAVQETPVDICRMKSLPPIILTCRTPISFVLQSIKQLRSLAAEKFAIDASFKSAEMSTVVPIGPKYDNCFLPKSIKELRKEAPMKARLVGLSRSEGLFFYLFDLDIYDPELMMEDNLAAIIPEKRFPRNAKTIREKAAEKLISRKTNTSIEEWNNAAVESKGDSFLNVAIQLNILEILEIHPKTPLYVYTFDYFNPESFADPSISIPFLDSTHSTDLTYVFAKPIMFPFQFSNNDLEMIEITTRFWTNFAKYGFVILNQGLSGWNYRRNHF